MKTKPILACSLSFNLIALILGGARLYQGQNGMAPVVVPERKSPMEKTAEAAPVVTSAPQPETRSLRWSDLVSSDNETYTRNLRAIGCPDSTIRDILTAAIGRHYDLKRRDVAVQYQQDRMTKIAMEAAVAQLWDEQNDEVNQLSRIVAANVIAAPAAKMPSSVVAGTAVVVEGTQAGSISRDPAVRMPVALVEADSALQLNAAQEAAIVQAGDNFAKALSASKLAPTDPAYHQLWQQAQAEADERLQVQIGGETYLQMETRSPASH